MKLSELHFENFKGLKSFSIKPQGQDLTIYGDNGTGKTTIADGISWLLFGKDSRGNTQFDIKTIDPETEKPMNGLEHMVEGIFDLENGERIVLKKIYKEVWTRKRGDTHPTFTGHTTEYFVNGVPCQLKGYGEAVAGIAKESMFRLLTTPNYFPEILKWKDRLSIINEICPDVTPEEVVLGNPEFEPLADLLEKKKREDRVKVLDAELKKINEQLKKLPTRVDEQKRSIPIEVADLEAEREVEGNLNTAIATLEREKATIEAGGKTGRLEKELMEAEAQLSRVKAKHFEEIGKEVAGREKTVSSVRTALGIMEGDLADLKRRLAAKKEEKPVDNRDRIRRQMDELREEWKRIDAQVYTYIGDTCPNCGHNLHEKEGAEEEFNRRRAEQLEEIDQRGYALKEQLDGAEKVLAESQKRILEEIHEFGKKVGALETEIKLKTAERDRLQREVDEIHSRPVEGGEAYMKALAAVGRARERLEEAENGEQSDELKRVSEKLASHRENLKGVRERIKIAENKLATEARIQELLAEEKDLAGKYERLQGEKNLLEQYERAEAKLLEGKVESYFELAKFRLFKDRLNGGIEPCCEVIGDGGVPYSSGLNNGARINVGLDIIKTLSRHYGISMPVIVDNAESITKLIPMDAQVIRLVVSEDYQTLTVE